MRIKIIFIHVSLEATFISFLSFPIVCTALLLEKKGKSRSLQNTQHYMGFVVLKQAL